jgi:Fur family transcriptional regulator, ferric uptake regulator
MSSVKDRFNELLKEAGYSRTAARTAVFEALLGQEPLSMHQLVQNVPSADRASVYRTVELLERLGIAQRLYSGWKYKIELTDKFTEHHHHLTCLACGRTTPINEQELESFIVDLAHRHGFQPTIHQVEIQGFCSHCTKQRRAAQKAGD